MVEVKDLIIDNSFTTTVDNAKRIAAELGSNRVGAGHMVLAIFDLPYSTGATVLREFVTKEAYLKRARQLAEYWFGKEEVKTAKILPQVISSDKQPKRDSKGRFTK